MTKPLDVRLHDAVKQVSHLLTEAAGTPYTRTDFTMWEDPAGDTTSLSIGFTIMHTGDLARETATPEPHQKPQEPAQSVVEDRAEEVPAVYRTLDDSPPPDFPDQTPCQRPACGKPRWKHYADENGGYAACREFVDKNQMVLV